MGDSRRVSRKPEPVSLSQVLFKFPSTAERGKICAVEKGIQVLDQVADRFASVRKLFLSRNLLTDLEGIQQFQQLAQLSLADNRIRQVEDLQPLAEMPQLEALTVRGNPLCEMPNYRSHVVVALPQLKTLDGSAITRLERGSAASVVAKQEGMMTVMASNAMLAHRLTRAIQVIRLHTELRYVVWGGASPAARRCLPRTVPCDAGQLLVQWEAAALVSPAEQMLVRSALLREVARMRRSSGGGGGGTGAGTAPMGESWKQLAAEWDPEFSQVLLAQANTISRLMSVLQDGQREAWAGLEDILGADPQGCLAAVREQNGIAQRSFRSDREVLIREFRDAVLEQKAQGSAASGGRTAPPATGRPRTAASQGQLTPGASPTKPALSATLAAQAGASTASVIRKSLGADPSRPAHPAPQPAAASPSAARSESGNTRRSGGAPTASPSSGRAAQLPPRKRGRLRARSHAEPEHESMPLQPPYAVEARKLSDAAKPPAEQGPPASSHTAVPSAGSQGQRSADSTSLDHADYLLTRFALTPAADDAASPPRSRGVRPDAAPAATDSPPQPPGVREAEAAAGGGGLRLLQELMEEECVPEPESAWLHPTPHPHPQHSDAASASRVWPEVPAAAPAAYLPMQASAPGPESADTVQYRSPTSVSTGAAGSLTPSGPSTTTTTTTTITTSSAHLNSSSSSSGMPPRRSQPAPHPAARPPSPPPSRRHMRMLLGIEEGAELAVPEEAPQLSDDDLAHLVATAPPSGRYPSAAPEMAAAGDTVAAALLDAAAGAGDAERGGGGRGDGRQAEEPLWATVRSPRAPPGPSPGEEPLWATVAAEAAALEEAALPQSWLGDAAAGQLLEKQGPGAASSVLEPAAGRPAAAAEVACSPSAELGMEQHGEQAATAAQPSATALRAVGRPDVLEGAAGSAGRPLATLWLPAEHADVSDREAGAAAQPFTTAVRPADGQAGAVEAEAGSAAQCRPMPSQPAQLAEERRQENAAGVVEASMRPRRQTHDPAELPAPEASALQPAELARPALHPAPAEAAPDSPGRRPALPPPDTCTASPEAAPQPADPRPLQCELQAEPAAAAAQDSSDNGDSPSHGQVRGDSEARAASPGLPDISATSEAAATRLSAATGWQDRCGLGEQRCGSPEEGASASALQQQLQQRSQEVADLQQQLQQRSQEVADRQQLLQQRSQEVADLQQQLQQRSQQAADLQQQLQQRSQQAADLQQLLQQSALGACCLLACALQSVHSRHAAQLEEEKQRHLLEKLQLQDEAAGEVAALAQHHRRQLDRLQTNMQAEAAEAQQLLASLRQDGLRAQSSSAVLRQQLEECRQQFADAVSQHRRDAVAVQQALLEWLGQQATALQGERERLRHAHAAELQPLRELLHRQQQQQLLQESAERLARRALLRRALARLAEATQSSLQLRCECAAAEAMASAGLRRRGLSALKEAARRSRGLSRMHQDSMRRLARRAWSAWHAFLQRRAQRRAAVASVQHHWRRTAAWKCLHAWARHTCACRLPAEEDSPCFAAAALQRRRWLLKAALAAWTAAARPASGRLLVWARRRHLRNLLHRSFCCWRGAADAAGASCVAAAELATRRQRKLLQEVAAEWHACTALQGCLRQSSRELARAQMLAALRRWRAALQHAAAQHAAAAQADLAGSWRRMRLALRSWRRFLLLRQRRRVGDAMGAQARRHRLCWKAWALWQRQVARRARLGLASRALSEWYARRLLQRWRAAAGAQQRQRSGVGRALRLRHGIRSRLTARCFRAWRAAALLSSRARHRLLPHLCRRAALRLLRAAFAAWRRAAQLERSMAVAGARSAVAQMEEQLAAAEERAGRSQAESEQLTQRMLAMSRQQSVAAASSSELQQRAQVLDSALGAALEQLHLQHQALVEARAQAESVEAQSQETIRGHRAACDSLLRDLNHRQLQLQRAEQSLTASGRFVRKQEESQSALQALAATALESAAAAEGHAAGLELEMGALEEREGRLQQEMARWKGKASALQGQLQQQRQDLDSLAAQLLDSQAAVASGLNQHQRSQAQLQQVCGSLRQQLQQAEHRSLQLREQLQRQQRQAAQLHQVLGSPPTAAPPASMPPTAPPDAASS